MTDQQPPHSITTALPTSAGPGTAGVPATPGAPTVRAATGPHPPAIVAGAVFVAIAILGALVESGRIPVNWTDSALLWCAVLGLLAVAAGVVGLLNRRR